MGLTIDDVDDGQDHPEKRYESLVEKNQKLKLARSLRLSYIASLFLQVLSWWNSLAVKLMKASLRSSLTFGSV